MEKTKKKKVATKVLPATIEKPKRVSIDIYADEEHGTHAITFSEQAKILRHLEGNKYQHFFFFCCCTGVRACEVLNIKFKDIDFKKKIIKITLKDTKTKKHQRDIPFHDDLFERIKIKKRGLLFAEITEEGSKQFFLRLYNKLKLELSRHSTRHTFISVCNKIGIKPEIIQGWAGHTTLKMTTDVYTHKLRKGDSPILRYCEKLKKQLKI